MKEQILDKKNYQVFVHGTKTEQEGEAIFIQSPSETRDDLISRGLGGSRFLNLHLIVKYDGAAKGNFGGSSKAQQATMFESTSPIHFLQLADAIENKVYKPEQDLKINRNGQEQMVPVVKLNGIFEDTAIHKESVEAFYLAFRNDAGEYELQHTPRYIGNEWITTPSEQTSVTVVLFGEDANDANLINAIGKEERRMNVEAFNKDEINARAAEAGINIGDIDAFTTWFNSIATGRVKAVYANTTAEAEVEVEITQGENTGQPGQNTTTSPVPGQEPGTGNQPAQAKVV